MSPLDLHVLGTPPAFVLSQDQTLPFNPLSHPALRTGQTHSESSVSFLRFFPLSVSLSRFIPQPALARRSVIIPKYLCFVNPFLKVFLTFFSTRDFGQIKVFQGIQDVPFVQTNTRSSIFARFRNICSQQKTRLNAGSC